MNDATVLLDNLLAELPTGNLNSSTPFTRTYDGPVIQATQEQAEGIIRSFLKKQAVNITEGGRHAAMCKYAVLMRMCGFTDDQMRHELITFDKKRNNPPKKDADEIAGIIQWVGKIRPGLRAAQTTIAPRISVKESDALEFLRNDPMTVIRDQYFRLHYGDQDALSTVLWGFCVKWIKISYDEGIHIIAIGERGSGKTHGIVVSMGFLPPELAWVKGISARYLYYAKNLVRGLTVYLDELPSDQNLIDCLKSIISAYPNGSSRGTVINGEGREQYIPARITINTSSVDQKADEQFTNRMTVIRATTNSTNRNMRVDFRIKLYEGDVDEIDPAILARIHNALRYIASKNFTVTIPKGAIGHDTCREIDTRVLNQFMCAMMGNAILNFPNRNPSYDGDDVHITVSKEDFDAVIHLYQNPDEYLLKLTPAAILIKTYMEKISPDCASIGDIADEVGLSTQCVRTSIKGRPDRNVDCLITAGYIEEVTQSDQKVVTMVNREGQEYDKPTGPRLSSKVYRATRKLEGAPQRKIADDNKTLSGVVGMLQWIQVDEQTKQTTANQQLVCTNQPLYNDNKNQTNQILSGGFG